MKPFSKSLLGLLLCCTALSVTAQNNTVKPAQFAGLPQTIQVNKAILAATLNNQAGRLVQIDFGNGLKFKGTVSSNVQRYNNLQIIIIKSLEDPNQVLQISMITHPDNTVRYTGRIINPQASDGYELKSNAGMYEMVKFETDRVLQDCHF
ncbi:MAG: hypothetical protein IPL97_03620 [Niastella sp.]|nr:hypothetical protein [Niastella sp.]